MDMASHLTFKQDQKAQKVKKRPDGDRSQKQAHKAMRAFAEK